jgi:hypothetical protein
MACAQESRQPPTPDNRSKTVTDIIERAKNFLESKSVDNSFKIITAFIEETQKLNEETQRLRDEVENYERKYSSINHLSNRLLYVGKQEGHSIHIEIVWNSISKQQEQGDD